MFCGWRLHGSKSMLVQLGSDRLVIDVLTGQCVFEGKPIAQLPISLELVGWARQDLEKHRLDTSYSRASFGQTFLQPDTVEHEGQRDFLQ
jgi:hypothetical protein